MLISQLHINVSQKYIIHLQRWQFLQQHGAGHIPFVICAFYVYFSGSAGGHWVACWLCLQGEGRTCQTS